MSLSIYSKAAVDAGLGYKANLTGATFTGSVTAPNFIITSGGGGSLTFADGTHQTTAYTGSSSVTWGSITGTLSNQTDLQNALNAKAPIASPTFTGTVTIPSGASIAGYATQSYVTTALAPYLTSATAASTYQTISGMSAYALLASPAFTGTPTAPTASSTDNSTTIATTAFVANAVAGATVTATTSVVATVRNQTGATVPKGSVIYLNGSGGNKPLLALAKADAQATSAGTYGIVQSAINNNNNGTAVVSGIISGLDTSAYTAGTVLWLSATTAGGFTSTMPAAPNHSVQIGIVTYQHSQQGAIQLNITNGEELTELHDVQITSPAQGDLLYYADSSTTLWKNAQPGTLGIATQSYVTTALAPYLTSATAASTYQTISGMSAYLTTASAASTYAPIASPTFTGTVTIPSGASIAGYATQSYVTSQGYITSSALTPYLLSSTASSTYAPLASPALTGTPTAPTALTADNSTTIATTAFVKAQGYITSAPVTSVAGRTGAVTLSVGDVSGAAPLASPTFTGTVTIPAGASISGYATTSSLSSYAPLASPTFTGTVTIPAGASISGYATTSSLSSYAPLASPTFTGTVTIPAGASISGYATTSSLSSYAPLASPALTGTPTSTTAAVDTNTTQIATTAYVVGQGYLKSSTASSTYAPLASPALTGTPTAPTATTSTNTTQIATTAYVQSNLSSYLTTSTASSTYAPLASPALTGTPTSTTPATADNSTKIATTAYVQAQGYIGSSGLANYALLASPTFTGTPAAPTAATATNTTQIATTAFVKAQGYAPLASPAFTGTPTSTTPATADNSTNIATTAYVQAQGYAPLASPTFTGTPNSVTGTTNTGGTQIATQAFVRNSVQQGMTNFTATVVSNSLQITLNGGQAFFFRPATLNSATNTVYTTTSMGLIVPSGATLGTVNNVQAQLVLVLVYNGGSPQVGIVNIAGGFNLDETTLISTTAISASSTANNVVYTTSAITGSPFRVLGYITITEATAGTWATAPTLTQGAGGEAAVGYQTVGMGQTYQNKTSSRAAATTYYNTTPKPIYLSIFFNHGVSNGAGTSQINVNGVQVTSNLNPSGRYNFTSTAIVPPGFSYSVTLTGDASINTWFELS